MSIWHSEVDIKKINEMNENTMVKHCDIEITRITDGSLEGQMIVSDKIKQPFGIVHGGANCVLAETLGSIAANLTCDPQQAHAVGLSITTNHVKAVRNGIITGIAKPVHLGGKIQVWDITTFNNKDQITSKTSLTMAIIARLNESQQ